MHKNLFGIRYLIIGLIGLISTIIITVINGPSSSAAMSILILLAFFLFTGLSIFGIMALYESWSSKS